MRHVFGPVHSLVLHLLAHALEIPDLGHEFFVNLGLDLRHGGAVPGNFVSRGLLMSGRFLHVDVLLQHPLLGAADDILQLSAVELDVGQEVLNGLLSGLLVNLLHVFSHVFHLVCADSRKTFFTVRSTHFTVALDVVWRDVILV